MTLIMKGDDDEKIGGRWDGAFSTLLFVPVGFLDHFHFTANLFSATEKRGERKYVEHMANPTGTQSIGKNKKKECRDLFVLFFLSDSI